MSSRIGEFDLISRVAQGGMATLYLASRPGSDEPVAIKVVHPHLSADWEAMRWFVDEALISIRIRHPNVVRVDELGEQDGLYYLAMEYVHGVSLAALMASLGKRARKLSPELAAYIALSTAEGLHAAHETRGEGGELLGVVHRDISPQNILIGHGGEVKLVDFGIAKAEGRAERSKQGEVRGKYRYMAPEQIRGQDQDRRVDVFALGIVLWEMLTGKRLYANVADHDLVAAVSAPVIERPSEHREGLPPALDGVVMVTTTPDAEARIATAAEVGEALRPLVTPGASAELGALVTELFGGSLLASARALPDAMQPLVGADALQTAVDAELARRAETRRVRSSVPPAKPPSRYGGIALLVFVLVLLLGTTMAAVLLLGD